MSASELSSLYKNRPVLLWVEDPLTRSYLHALWQDPDIGLLVAGGNDAVFAAVRDARVEGHVNVFGFRDRDFLVSNRSKWLDPSKRPEVFVPDAFEIENHLLDFRGLAALDRNYNPKTRSESDLHQRARDHAEASLWWMVARSCITDVRKEVTEDFPGHPTLKNPPTLTSEVATQTALEATLLDSAWGSRLQTWVPTLSRAWISEHIAAHETALRAALHDGSWTTRWSGKELFTAMAGHLHTPHGDLAKGLAAQQRSTGWPSELRELRDALRKRTALDPW